MKLILVNKISIPTCEHTTSTPAAIRLVLEISGEAVELPVMPSGLPFFDTSLPVAPFSFTILEKSYLDSPTCLELFSKSDDLILFWKVHENQITI